MVFGVGLAKLAMALGVAAAGSAAIMDNKTPTKAVDTQKVVVESKAAASIGYLGNDGVWHLS